MRIENDHYPEPPRKIYLMMNVLEKVMIMITSDDFPLTSKTPHHVGNGESDDDDYE